MQQTSKLFDKGSNPLLPTNPDSSTDRIVGYEPTDTSSNLVRDTKFHQYHIIYYMDQIKNDTDHFIVYQITNLINHKIYIGMHKTKNLNDGYMGSGKIIRSAIQKYGKENFSKKILFVCDSEDDMRTKEKELVTQEFVNRKDTYNLTLGGKGGFYYINKMGLAKSKEHLKIAQEKKIFLLQNDAEYKKDFIQKIKCGQTKKDAMRKMVETRRNNNKTFKTFLGRHHTQETKRKISQTLKHRQTTSTLGKHWFTDGKDNILCYPDKVPHGFSKGRILKH